MLRCEGFKMFRGKMLVDFQNGATPFSVEGTWLHKPNDEYWYLAPTQGYPWGSSFEEKFVTILEDVS